MGGPAQVQKHDTGPDVNHTKLTLGHRGPALVRLKKINYLMKKHFSGWNALTFRVKSFYCPSSFMTAPGQRALVESYHPVALEEEHGRFQQGGRGASQRGLAHGKDK